MLSDAEITGTREKCYRLARRRKLSHELADDFASYFLERLLRGDRLIMRTALVDFYRQQFGDSRPGHSARNGKVHLTDVPRGSRDDDGDDEEREVCPPKDIAEDNRARADFFRRLSDRGLVGEYHALMVLWVLFGMRLDELALIFGRPLMTTRKQLSLARRLYGDMTA